MTYRKGIEIATFDENLFKRLGVNHSPSSMDDVVSYILIGTWTA